MSELKATTPETIIDTLRTRLVAKSITMSKYYRVGADYPYGGGYLLSCMGDQFGAIQWQGGMLVVASTYMVRSFDLDEPAIKKLMEVYVHAAWRRVMDEDFDAFLKEVKNGQD